MPLTVHVGDHTLTAEWSDDAPKTRRAIRDALPLAGDANRWGDELYFRTEVDVAAENARQTVDPGTIAYWPQGNAVCLFWGPTPASTGPEPTAASPVNVVARLDEVEPLTTLDGNARVRIEAE